MPLAVDNRDIPLTRAGKLMLRYYMHDGPSAFRFELFGTLDSAEAREIEQAWRTASSVFRRRVLVIDFSSLNDLDDEGRELLAMWRDSGARFIATSERAREIADSAKVPLLLPVAAVRETRSTWPSLRRYVFSLAAIAVSLLFPAAAQATGAGHDEDVYGDVGHCGAETHNNNFFWGWSELTM